MGTSTSLIVTAQGLGTSLMPCTGTVATVNYKPEYHNVEAISISENELVVKNEHMPKCPRIK